MKLVIAATGASGTIYLQRLLEQVDYAAHEVHLIMSGYAKQVAKQEIGILKIPKAIAQHSENDLNVPFVSGSARFDAVVVITASPEVRVSRQVRPMQDRERRLLPDKEKVDRAEVFQECGHSLALEADATRDARRLSIDVLQPLLVSADAQGPVRGARPPGP